MSTKQAGQFEVEASEGGWPTWITVTHHQGGSEPQRFHGLKVDDLKDLHYCATEILAKLQRAQKED